MKKLGQNIRLLRHEKGWSQEDVSKRLNLSIPAFSKIETGITDINLSRMEQIAVVFGISTIQLLMLRESDNAIPNDELIALNEKLVAREIQVIELQKKVIELFEELMLLKRFA